MDGKALGLTERDRLVLSETSRFGVVTRDQLIRLKLFGSKTRANERLRKLVAEGYLAARRQPLHVGGPRFVYLPGPALKDGQETRRRWSDASDLFVHHQLGLVDIRLAFEQHATLTRWATDKELASNALGVIPDAYLEYQTHALTFCCFIEYDRGTETVGRVDNKVRAYVELAYSGRFERAFGRRFFRLLLITDSPKRLTVLSDSAARITDKIVRFTTLQQLSQDGPLASIWRRPGVQTPESLMVV
jgi:hypothetical protein